MVKKYICELCAKPCILRVEKEASEPLECPYYKNEHPEWELMKGDEQT